MASAWEYGCSKGEGRYSAGKDQHQPVHGCFAVMARSSKARLGEDVFVIPAPVERGQNFVSLKAVVHKVFLINRVQLATNFEKKKGKIRNK